MQRRPSSGKRTSRPIAKLASKVLRDARFGPTAKPVAAGAPSQRTRKHKKK